jgi:hypothetical protein
VTWKLNNSHAIAKSDVFTLEDYLKTSFSQSSLRLLLADPKESKHQMTICSRVTRVLKRRSISGIAARYSPNRFPDIVKSFLLGVTLTHATGKILTPNSKTFLRFD